MSDSLKVKHSHNGEYRIYIENNLDGFTAAVKDVIKEAKPKALILSDSNVSKLYLDDFAKLCGECFSFVDSFIIEAGESSKNYNNAVKCWNILKENDFHRSDYVIALGGGVVGDLTGFIASTYMRGIGFIQVPTSLLAMADSSIGGKVAVDLDGYKNLVGSIYMPSLVYESVSFLKTLPEREFACGMAEILKAGLIKNASFYEWLINNYETINEMDSEAIKYMLREADTVKQKVVEKDPYEKGERMHLNFGHTIGHAIEKSSSFNYNHGECVALGMVCAAYISHKRDMIAVEEFFEIRDLLLPFNLPISIDSYNEEEIFDAIMHDKKNINGKLNFVLLNEIGNAVTVKDVNREEIKEAIDFIVAK